MSIWYQRASKEVAASVRKVMKKYHKPLFENGVTIDVVLAFTDRTEGTAISAGRGRYALACIRILSLKDRAMGRADAEMMIDAASMEGWKAEDLEAVIDHELTHLQIRHSKSTNEPMRDDLDRPCLVIRDHDHEFGWFDAPVRHYGAHAAEYQQALKLLQHASWMQPLLPGFAEAS